MEAIGRVAPLDDVHGEAGTHVGGMLAKVRDTMTDVTGQPASEIAIRDVLAVDTLVPAVVRGGLAGEVVAGERRRAGRDGAHQPQPHAVGGRRAVRRAGLRDDHRRGRGRDRRARRADHAGHLGADRDHRHGRRLHRRRAARPGRDRVGGARRRGRGAGHQAHRLGAGSRRPGRRGVGEAPPAGEGRELLPRPPRGRHGAVLLRAAAAARLREGRHRDPRGPRGRARARPARGGPPGAPRGQAPGVRRQRAAGAARRSPRRATLRLLGFVVLLGGSALDFEIPDMVADALAPYGVVCGIGNVHGTEGPRNAVAAGLVDAHAGTVAGPAPEKLQRQAAPHERGDQSPVRGVGPGRARLPRPHRPGRRSRAPARRTGHRARRRPARRGARGVRGRRGAGHPHGDPGAGGDGGRRPRPARGGRVAARGGRGHRARRRGGRPPRPGRGARAPAGRRRPGGPGAAGGGRRGADRRGAAAADRRLRRWRAPRPDCPGRRRRARGRRAGRPARSRCPCAGRRGRSRAG